MHELRPHKVARRAIRLLAILADAGLHFAFDRIHRLAYRVPPRLHDGFVAGQGLQYRNRFRADNVKS